MACCPREFTADEIVAFSRTFNLPIVLWFLPAGPDHTKEPTPYEVALVAAQLGDKSGQKEFEDRLTDLFLAGHRQCGSQLIWDRVVERASQRTGVRRCSQSFERTCATCWTLWKPPRTRTRREGQR